MAGHTHGVMAVEHTSMPARRNAPMSRMLSVRVRGRRAVVHQRVGLERDERVDDRRSR